MCFIIIIIYFFIIFFLFPMDLPKWGRQPPAVCFSASYSLCTGPQVNRNSASRNTAVSPHSPLVSEVWSKMLSHSPFQDIHLFVDRFIKSPNVGVEQEVEKKERSGLGQYRLPAYFTFLSAGSRRAGELCAWTASLLPANLAQPCVPQKALSFP